MNWFKRMVVKWVREDWDRARDEQDCYPTPKISAMNSISTRDVNSDPTLQFKIYSAIGGKVVEFSRYDRKIDRHHHDIYIIGKDEDFGEKIARIAMIENLKD
jgi:pSer/pThr/pTyr-binding forkhead associated (FHA) protein